MAKPPAPACLFCPKSLRLLRTDYPMGDECEDVKCGFYATCQTFDPDDDVINDVTQQGRARCVCPTFCPQVGCTVLSTN